MGKKAERHALLLLKSCGYKIIRKNYRNRFGEIDIVAFDRDTLVLVEVKFRSSHKFGLPEEAVDQKKLDKIKKVGYLFWKSNFPEVRKVRIDVVSVEIIEKSLRSKIIKNVY